MGVLKKLLSYDTVFTEELLEKIREQYVPTNWVSGEIITATRLNHMEQGIYENSKMAENTVQQDGEYPFLTAGLAENLESDTFTVNQTPYFLRQVINNSDREIDSVVGGSVAWNQLAGSPDTTTNHEVTFTKNADGSYTVSGTASGTADVSCGDINIVQGHKYFIDGGVSNNVYLVCTNAAYWGSNTERFDKGSGTIASATTSGISVLMMEVIDGYTCQNETMIPQIFDLTIIFGSTIADYIYTLETATAGSGIAKLKSWGFFADDYYEYDAGSIESVEGVSRHDMVGFNQWDEDWENGSYNNNGEKVPNSLVIRCKNPIPVIPNTTYYLKATSSATYTARYVFYDSKMHCISSVASQTVNASFTTPDNAHYFAFNLASGYGETYHYDICINISDSVRNGEYEPYVKYSYPLDSSLTLRGIPKLDADNNLYYDGDVYVSDGTVTRKRKEHTFDGTESLLMIASGTSGYNQFAFTPSPAKVYEDGAVQTIITADYAWKPYSETASTAINSEFVVTYGVEIRFVLNASNEADARSKLTGKSVVYELATPTTETADPFQNPQLVSAGGTEEYVSTGIVPVGHYTQYPENLKAKLEAMPNLPTQEGVYVLKYENGTATYILLETDETVVDMLARIAALEGE